MRLIFTKQVSWLALLSFWLVALAIPHQVEASGGLHKIIARHGIYKGSSNSSAISSSSRHDISSSSSSAVSSPTSTPVTPSEPPTSSVSPRSTAPGPSIPVPKSSSSTSISHTRSSSTLSSLSLTPSGPSNSPGSPITPPASSASHSSFSGPGSTPGTSSSSSPPKISSSQSGNPPSTLSSPKPSSGSTGPIPSSRNTAVPVISTELITEPSTTLTSIIVSSSTAPFPITLNTDSPQATSSVSYLQSEISATLIPILSKLVETKDKSKAEDAIRQINKVEPDAKNLLNKLDPDSEGSCSGGSGNILSDLVNAMSCIDDGLNKIKSEVEEGVNDKFSNIDDIKDTVSEITDLTDDSDDNQSSSDSSSSSTSSSSSCSSTTTTEDIYVECFTTSGPGRRRQAAASCTTSTKTVTGCDVSAFTTTTATSCSETQTITNCDVTCPTTAAPQSNLVGRAAATSCSTTCSTQTGCSSKGSTSTSWSTTTTTPSSSSGAAGQCAATGCSSCASLSTPTASSVAKRETGDLSKRTLTSPNDPPYNGDTGSFLVDQYVWAEWVPLGSNAGSVPTALYRELKNQAYNMAVQGLYGCTSVVVMSEKAVYMTHFWEVPGFSQGNWGIGSHERFEQEVLIPLENGGGDIPGLKQYAGGDNAFAAQYRPAAYVVRPGSSGRPDYDKAYDKKVDQIVEKLKNILGVKAPIPVTYSRTPGAHGFQPQGKVLFQYDPVQSRQSSGSCSVQQAMERFWVEDKPMYVYQKYWIAYDDQKVAQSGNQKRDCPASVTAGGQIPLSSAFGSTGFSSAISSSTSSSTTALSSSSSSLSSISLSPSSTPTPSSTLTSTPSSTTTPSSTPSSTPSPTTTSTAETTSTTETPTTTEQPTTTTTETPTPTAQIIIAYVVDGYNNNWSVFDGDAGDDPDWCDGTSNEFKASGNISLKDVPYPPDDDFDFDINDMSDCSYSGSDDGPGTLSCPNFSEDVQCSEYSDQSEQECYNIAAPMEVVPKVLCEWG